MLQIWDGNLQTTIAKGSLFETRLSEVSAAMEGQIGRGLFRQEYMMIMVPDRDAPGHIVRECPELKAALKRYLEAVGGGADTKALTQLKVAIAEALLYALEIPTPPIL